jgi:transcriptional regulator with XRE-family HTH domain
MDISIIARQLRDRRKELKMSQEALSKRSKVSRNYISLIESEQIDNVSLSIVNRLAVALGITPGRLTGEVKDVGRGALVIDPALAEFANVQGLGVDEILALARIEYRGARPRTVREWHELYNVVKKLAPRK